MRGRHPAGKIGSCGFFCVDFVSRPSCLSANPTESLDRVSMFRRAVVPSLNSGVFVSLFSFYVTTCFSH